jgi:hypothetical protein
MKISLHIPSPYIQNGAPRHKYAVLVACHLIAVQPESLPQQTLRTGPINRATKGSLGRYDSNARFLGCPIGNPQNLVASGGASTTGEDTLVVIVVNDAPLARESLVGTAGV